LEYGDITPLFKELNQRLSSMGTRNGSVHLVTNNPGIVRIELSPVDPTDPRHHFIIKNCNQNALKMKVIFGNGTFLERCLLVRGEPGHFLTLVEEFSFSKVIHTVNGCYIYREMMTLEATAYYPGPECTGKSSDGLTATGAIAAYGICAVDPELIPLGTRLYVPGYGLARALDVGGAIKGKRIDLCFNTYPEAVRYGRKRVKVFILD
jgi:3D (Asp-Asp-Asp) domain-containing protein